MDELDIPPGKLSESAQRIVDRAVEESRRRDHAMVGPEHLFLAFAQVEWNLFSEVIRELDLNPYAILQTLDDHLARHRPVEVQTTAHGLRRGQKAVDHVEVERWYPAHGPVEPERWRRMLEPIRRCGSRFDGLEGARPRRAARSNRYTHR